MPNQLHPREVTTLLPRLFQIGFSGLLLLLTGCAVVVTDKALGEKPYALDPSEVDGVWYMEGEEEPQPFFVRVMEDGRLLLAGVEETETGFKLVELEVHVRSTGDELSLSGKSDDESDDTEGYLFAWVVEKSAEKWVLRLPELAISESAIETEKLEGEITKSKFSTVVAVQSEALGNFIRTTPDLWFGEERITIRKFAPVTE